MAKRYKIGSERTFRYLGFRVAKDGEMAIEYDGSGSEVYFIASNGQIPVHVVELVKDFDVAEPVTAEDAVKLAKMHIGTLHYPSGNCASCAVARDILERAGER